MSLMEHVQTMYNTLPQGHLSDLRSSSRADYMDNGSSFTIATEDSPWLFLLTLGNDGKPLVGVVVQNSQYEDGRSMRVREENLEHFADYVLKICTDQPEVR